MVSLTPLIVWFLHLKDKKCAPLFNSHKTVPHVTLKSIANSPEIREGMTREQIDAE